MTAADPPGPAPGAGGTPARFYRSYDAQAGAWDAEFARISGRFGDRMQCRKGCSMCCSQMFPISLVEGAVISRAVAAMPVAARKHLQQAAREYLAEARRQGLTTGDDEDAVLPRPGARLTCPALQDDACTLYAARPLICRKWGIPVFDPAKPDRLHACELNFRSGEEIEAGDLVRPQRALLEEWSAVKDDLRDTVPECRTTTVAEAIVTDFATLLERAG